MPDSKLQSPQAPQLNGSHKDTFSTSHNFPNANRANPVKQIIQNTPASYSSAESNEDIDRFLQAAESIVLVSFPRSGSHWLRMMMELYFDRPTLTRSFYKHNNKDYLLLHDHDMDFTLERQNVIYLYRNPTDTIFSQLNYYQEDENDLARISFWVEQYGKHLSKWLFDENSSRHKLILNYEELQREPLTQLQKLAEFYHVPFDSVRAQECVDSVSKKTVRQKTEWHNAQVQNVALDYAQRRDVFREKYGDLIHQFLREQKPQLKPTLDPFNAQPQVATLDHKIAGNPSKIVGLVAGRNESNFIEQTLRALAVFTDAIVFYDDASTDNTVEIVQSLASTCNIEKIIRNHEWRYNEHNYRSRLLQAGREIGGTHFIALDADEMFTANLLAGDQLRNLILSLKPQEQIALAWIQLWRNTKQYRFDSSVWSNNYKAFIFCDDGATQYDDIKFHLGRTPNNNWTTKTVSGYEYGVLHFQFVNWRNLLVKQAWYRCLERVYQPQKSISEINTLYAPSKDESNLGLKPAPAKWFEGYTFFEPAIFNQPENWREAQVLSWFEQYGRDFFAGLDIWDVDWGTGVNVSPQIAQSSGDNQPVVSAIVSTYNSEQFIRGCLENLEAQTIADRLEIVVIDSGSEQNEKAIVEEFQQRYDNIVYIRTEERETVYAAWNRGINVARGKYITNANTDDRHRSDAFERMVEVLDKQPDIALVYADQLITETPNEKFSKTKAARRWNWPEYSYRELETQCIVGPQPMWRKKLHQKYGGFDPSFFSAGDYEFWLRIGKNEQFYRIPDVLGLYYQNPDGVENSSSKSKSEFETIRQAYDLNGPRHFTYPVPVSHDELVALQNRSFRVQNYDKLISVVIPYYNRPEILAQCLNALKTQTLPQEKFEVICVNDGSPDSEIKLVCERAFEDLPGLYLEHTENQGRGQARNTGLRQARGKYILFLDSDILPDSNLLEEHLLAHQQYPGKKLAVLSRIVLPPELLQHNILARAIDETTLVLAYATMVAGELYNYMHFYTGCISIPRQAYEIVGEFDETYKTYGVEDTEYGYRLEQAGYKILYHPAACSVHVDLPPSIDKFCRRQRLVAANFAHFFATHPETLHQPSWQEMYPINQQALQAHLAQYESGLDRVLTEAKKLETFDLKLIANDPTTSEKLITAARDLLIYLHRYYWYSGLLDGLQQYGIDSFAEFERIRVQTQIKISVIIPTYNRSEILLKCLGALSRQTLPADQFEVLVCDDGSTDQTRAIVENHSSSYALTYIWQQNSGPAAARNKGVRAARGEYILFINDDTILAPGALAAHLQAHREKGQQKMAVLGTFVYVPAAQRSPFVYFLEQTDIVFAYPMMQPGQFYNYRFFWTCNLSLKRQALLDVGLFDEDFVEPMVEDTELGYRLEKLGYAVLYHPAAQAHHDHTMNIHSFIRRQEMSGRNVIKLFQKHPELLPREKQLFGFDNLAEPTLEKFRHYLQQHEPVVPELIKKFDEMEQFNVDQLKTVVSANNGKSVTAADEFVEIMKTGIWPIHFTSFYRGILQATAHNGHAPAQQYSTGRPQPEPAVPLKILFVMYGWADDGGGTMLPRQMATSLAQKGHQVAVVYAAARPANGQPAYHVEEHWEKGVHLFGIYNRQSLFLNVENPDRESDDPQARQIVLQIIQRFQPDVVHYHNLLGLSMGIAADVAHMGLPSLYTSHNYWPLCPRLYLFQQDLALCGGPSADGGKCAACLGQPEQQPAYARRVAAGRQMLNRHVDRHLAISTRARQLFVENGIEAGRIHVLHQSTQMIDQIWAQVGRPRSPLPALNRPLRVGFLGSLLPHKGVHVLVDALQSFTKTEVEAHIFGAGPDNYIQTLKSLDKKRLVKFHGAYQPEQLAQILSQVDVSVIPSIWEEGAGLVVVEALAARVPVIGSRSGGIPDFIRPDHNGFLFNPGDAGDLAAQLRQFLADPGLLGRLQAQINPPQTFDAFLDKLLGHYRQVIQAQLEGSRKDLPLNTNEQPLNRIRFDQNLGHGFSNRVAGGKLPQPLPQPLYLNLGCGNDVRPGFVNIDLFSDDPGVVGMDVRQLDLPDNCADGIIASDILEHFSHREVDAVLREWARVLKPGGELVVRSPSLRLQAKAYLHGVWDADIASYMIFGGQTNPGDYHCIGFDEASIRKHLEQTGLAVARFEEVDTPQDKSFINLNLTVWATKPQPVATSPLPTSPTAEPVSVVWEGSQFVTHSLALINREVAIRLGQDSQIELSLLPFEPHQFGPEADPRFAVIANHLNRPLSQPAQVHVRHQWPPSFTPPAAGHWVVIQPWEFGSLPKQWVQVFASQVDEMWVPSNYVRDSYIRSGIPAERVFTVHNGLNLDQFRPTAPPYPLKTRKKFKFLFVGGTILRKGIDILLEVYSRTYSADDDVCLVIKDMGGDSFYQGRNARQHIEQLQAQPGAPEIEYIGAILSDAELAGLYTACDCLVHPYRGEGFGLPIAEAMASGLPVIVTGHGAALDYCHPGNAYLIPAREVRLPEKRIGDWETVDWPWWAEPDAAALQLLMRRVLNNPTDAAAKAKVGMAEVRANFSWDKMAAAIKDRLLVLRNQPIRRHATTPAGAVETMQRLLQPGQAALEAGNLPAAAEAFRQVAEANPEFAAAFVAWGSTLQALGRLAEAAPVLRRAAELVPTLPDLPNQLGVIYVQLAEWEQAEAAFWQAHQLAPEDVNTLLNLIDLYRAAGNYDAASEMVNRALAIDPAHSDVLLAFGQICADLGDVDGVELAIERLHGQPGADALRQRLAGAAPEPVGDGPQAAATPNNGHRQNPTAAGLESSAFDEQLALAQAAGDWPAAIELLNAELARRQTDADLWNSLGVAYVMTGQLEAAEDALRQGLAVAPEHLPILHNLADIYLQLEAFDQATEYLNRALRIDPNDVPLLLSLGNCAIQLGGFDTALAAFERVRELAPDTAGIDEVLVELAALQ